MSLIICPECAHEVSSAAAACPNCAHPFVKPVVQPRVVLLNSLLKLNAASYTEQRAHESTPKKLGRLLFSNKKKKA